MKRPFLFILLVFWLRPMGAQVGDSLEIIVDTLPVLKDTLGTKPSKRVIKLSKDSLDAKVSYGCRDSMRFDNVNKEIHLYGEAYVNYQTLALKANYIVVNMDSSIATAEVGRDSSGNLIGIPKFEDGDQNFDAMKMRYNFKSKKGLVYEAVTKEGDIFVRGTRTKYVSAESDSLSADDIIYNEDAIFTTCNHPEPHYGIRSKRQKVVPNKVVVVGSSQIELGGVPTPLMLPFGFFPVDERTKGRYYFPAGL